MTGFKTSKFSSQCMLIFANKMIYLIMANFRGIWLYSLPKMREQMLRLKANVLTFILIH